MGGRPCRSPAQTEPIDTVCPTHGVEAEASWWVYRPSPPGLQLRAAPGRLPPTGMAEAAGAAIAGLVNAAADRRPGIMPLADTGHQRNDGVAGAGGWGCQPHQRQRWHRWPHTHG